MVRRYFPIFWLCFVFLLLSWEFSNAAIPEWCNNPLPIQLNRLFSPENDENNFESNVGIFVYLCQVDMSDMAEIIDELGGLIVFAICTPENEEVLFGFNNANVITFKIMSGNTFEFTTRKDDSTAVGILRGRFQNFDDFKNFHILINGENSRYSPQDFTIVGLESYVFCKYNENTIDDISVIHTRPAIFSQYSIGDTDEFSFAIEDAGGTHLTFQPYQYKSTRDQIQSQVILTRSDNEKMYFIIGFDTKENASSFATYIGKFALPELPRISNELIDFLNGRV